MTGSDLYTTLLLDGRMMGVVRGFHYQEGEMIPGANVIATLAETNFSRYWPEPTVWLGLEWGLPFTSPARFQADPSSGVYTVSPNDIVEFTSKTYLELFAGDTDRPFVAYPLITSDVWRSEMRVYQQFTFPRPLSYSEGRRLFAQLSWPTAYPEFGTHPVSGRRGVLTVTLKLLVREPSSATPTLGQIDPDFARLLESARKSRQTEAGTRRGVTVPLPADFADLQQAERSRSQEIRTPDGRVWSITSDTDLPDSAEEDIDVERFRGLEGAKKS